MPTDASGAAADDPKSPGGSGGASAPVESGIRDTRLVERALRENWPIPEKLRGPLVDRLLRIVFDKNVSAREATSAAKAILSASKLNLESVAMSMKAQEHEELVARLEELERRTGREGRAR